MRLLLIGISLLLTTLRILIHKMKQMGLFIFFKGEVELRFKERCPGISSTASDENEVALLKVAHAHIARIP